MSDIEQLNQERQHLMKSFLKVKAELARVRKEKDQLEAENRKLKIDLEEQEIEYANLFGAIEAEANL